MPDDYFQLSRKDQLEVLQVAGDASRRLPHLFEKDIWVVWTLNALFQAPFGNDLVFKGGTSLSKAYGAIDRFSEDIDITYDIRAIKPELAGMADPMPPNSSQEKQWTKQIREQLPIWLRQHVAPVLQERKNAFNIDATIEFEKDDVIVAYNPLQAGSGYIKPRVRIEFGARSTGEPAEERAINCDAAQYVKGVTFPSATARVMKAERTFWEKATAAHVFCHKEHLTPRFARHWFDLVHLDDHGIAERAYAEHDIAAAVAKHKGIFFREKDKQKNPINYTTAVAGSLLLIPTGAAKAALARDYQHMIADGMIYSEPETFEKLLERCHDLQCRANATNRVKQIITVLKA